MVIAAIAAGTAARFHELGHDGLWSDELFTSSMVTQHPLIPEGKRFRRKTVLAIKPEDSFWTAKGAEQSPPLFEILTKGSVTVFGASEWSFRFVSALAGVLWLVFLGVRARRTPHATLRRAYLFALLVGVPSVFLVAYAQEARAYGLGTLLTGVIAALTLERFFEGFARAPLPRGWELGAYVAACHTHYDALVFVALLLVVYGVVALRTGRRRELARLALVPLCCVPWVIYFNRHTILFTSRGGVAWGAYSLRESMLGAFRHAAELPGTPLLALAGVGVIALVVRRLFTRTPVEAGVRNALVALSLFSFVYVLIIGYVTHRAGMMHPRYYLFLLPALHVGVGIVLAAAFTHTLLAALAMAALFAASLQPLREYYAVEREGYREVTHWLRAHTSANALPLYTWGPNLSMYRFYLERYYDRHADERAVPISEPTDAEAVCTQLSSAREVAVIGHSTHKPLVDAVFAACGDAFTVTQSIDERSVLGQVWIRH